MSALEALFWGSIGLIGFVYAGYPVLLSAASVLVRRPVLKRPFTPTVTVLISAHNEANDIRATVENKLSQRYPADRLSVIVIADGCTDGTADAVRAISDDRVRLVVQEPREGKTAALNRAVPMAAGEILVFSDANSLYADDATASLVENFADPDVGYVTGKMVYVDATGSVAGSGCTAYMRYENALRRLETNVGSVVGVDGGIDAARKSLYVQMRPDLLPDFVLPLQVTRQGFRVVYESRALLKESTLDRNDDEWRMRVRVGLRSFHAIWHMRALLNPFRHPIAAFQIIVHKVLRYWCGFFQLSALVSNAALAFSSTFYRGILFAHAVFYVLAFAGLLMGRLAERLPPVKYASYFCLLNAASLFAFFRFLQGKKMVTWAPRKG